MKPFILFLRDCTANNYFAASSKTQKKPNQIKLGNKE